jgi:hypothetical protein
MHHHELNALEGDKQAFIVAGNLATLQRHDQDATNL